MHNSAPTNRRCKAAKPAPGYINDPGLISMKLELPDSPARLEVGEIAFCYEAEEWSKCRITSGYGLKMVKNLDGAYLSDDGTRFDYRWGYSIQSNDRSSGFLNAGNLVHADGKPTHLRLATVNGKAVA